MVEIKVCDCEDKHGHVYKNGVNISPRIDTKSQITSIVGQLRQTDTITDEEVEMLMKNISIVEMPE